MKRASFEEHPFAKFGEHPEAVQRTSRTFENVPEHREDLECSRTFPNIPEHRDVLERPGPAEESDEG